MPMTRILFLIFGICKELIQMQLSEKLKIFCKYFSILKSSSCFKHFKKVDGSHGWCISKITDSEEHG